MPSQQFSATRSTDSSSKTFVGTQYWPDKPEPVPNPGYFRALRLKKPLPVGSWDRTFFRILGGSGSLDASYYWNYSGVVQKCTVNGNFGCPGDFHFDSKGSCAYDLMDSKLPLAALQNEAVHKAKNSSWDIGTFAAEAHKTADLLVGAHTRAYRRALDIINRYGGKWGRGAAAAGAFASAWLEYRYGWRILQYDLESMQDSLERLRTKEFGSLDRHTAYQSWTLERERDLVPGTTVEYPAGTSGPLLTTWEGQTPILIESAHRMKYQVEHRFGAGVSTTVVPHLTINPLLTLWEILPFSFIMDWYADVGAMLGANMPTIGRSLDYMWHTKKVTATTTSRTSWQPRPSTPGLYGKTYVGNSGVLGWRIEEERYIRTPHVFDPWKLSYNPRVNLAGAVDIAAICYSQKWDILRRFRI